MAEEINPEDIIAQTNESLFDEPAITVPASSNNVIVADVVDQIRTGSIYVNPYAIGSGITTANVTSFSQNAVTQEGFMSALLAAYPAGADGGSPGGIVLQDLTDTGSQTANSYSLTQHNVIVDLLQKYQNACSDFLFHTDARSGANDSPNYIATANGESNTHMSGNSTLSALSGLSTYYALNTSGNTIAGDFAAGNTINAMFSSIIDAAISGSLTLEPPPTNASIRIVSTCTSYRDRLLHAQSAPLVAGDKITVKEMGDIIADELRLHVNSSADSDASSTLYLGRFMRKWIGKDLEMQNTASYFQTSSLEAKAALSLAENDDLKPVLKIVGTQGFKEAANLV